MDTIAQQLKELAELHREGLLTADEFAIAKNDVLGRALDEGSRVERVSTESRADSSGKSVGSSGRSTMRFSSIEAAARRFSKGRSSESNRPWEKGGSGGVDLAPMAKEQPSLATVLRLSMLATTIHAYRHKMEAVGILDYANPDQRCALEQFCKKHVEFNLPQQTWLGFQRLFVDKNTSYFEFMRLLFAEGLSFEDALSRLGLRRE